MLRHNTTALQLLRNEKDYIHTKQSSACSSQPKYWYIREKHYYIKKTVRFLSINEYNWNSKKPPSLNFERVLMATSDQNCDKCKRTQRRNCHQGRNYNGSSGRVNSEAPLWSRTFLQGYSHQVASWHCKYFRDQPEKQSRVLVGWHGQFAASRRATTGNIHTTCIRSKILQSSIPRGTKNNRS